LNRSVVTLGFINCQEITDVWYFSWILGLGFALVFGVVNAMWYEVGERDTNDKRHAAK
jgi:cyd operon protein YbgT